MRKIVILLLVLVGVARAVLADQNAITLTVDSDPPGATLYANHDKHQLGSTPYTLTYQASKSFANGKACMAVQPLMVRWPSGVEAYSSSVILCPRNGATQHLLLSRRVDNAGRELVEQFAAHLDYASRTSTAN